ncbi:MAG: hypothetical protein A3F26_01990 [Candidatus Ryanbacteria bacterium RIFCSPHIGHO2_12_FULL_47_12b]|uniref:DUF4956 domain-containing protein n=2 Tax=Candidatus Ryaniibacteriota TaxID=1817914 RepID=A0A1G2H4Q1_9BACT|nr:MAG: hypothetical protein UX74_C0015G0012 [Parcubacteria group bacterium GW2011_GWA2_47_10b]OGZ53263.1 MAG: hypothetical protein A3F26_01990 [Candidatus Ryanbacteria bacterium RIFCSPHIGHO2_12_FULL_47_12b]OGZ55618.1 MAG: hypothetical protein A3J04_00655 [Candidatus Ryanbacteria bacterium RIFCSPLOWO2_02_FULL_47_14]OGZ57466.1 MAG: hypothetical protein A3G60_00495 [Candidatus Ryanbacteria bacterium RIFCSPLOWO2_12_FULL_47_9c]
MLDQFLFLAETETNAAIIIINLVFVFVLELAIAWVYRRTHRTLSYSQSFVSTIILMGVIASLIMMVVTENIVGAFALLGAFSLIRFRTIVKETRDIAFVFFSLAIGVAIGTNNYVVGLLGTIFISAAILLLNRFNFGSVARGGHIAVILAHKPFSPTIKNSWHDLLKANNILNIKTLGEEDFEYTLGIQLKNPADAPLLVETLRKTPGVENVEIMSGKDVIEY